MFIIPSCGGNSIDAIIAFPVYSDLLERAEIVSRFVDLEAIR